MTLLNISFILICHRYYSKRIFCFRVFNDETFVFFHFYIKKKPSTSHWRFTTDKNKKGESPLTEKKFSRFVYSTISSLVSHEHYLTIIKSSKTWYSDFFFFREIQTNALKLYFDGQTRFDGDHLIHLEINIFLQYGITLTMKWMILSSLVKKRECWLEQSINLPRRSNEKKIFPELFLLFPRVMMGESKERLEGGKGGVPLKKLK